MRFKKVIAALLAIFIAGMAAGCQLAREDMAKSDSGDRLIGVLITKEYLDLFDMEEYLNDNIRKISANGSIYINGNTSKYQGRLYASIATRTHIDPETGVPLDTKEFVFEGVEGIPYFCATIPATEEEEYSFTMTSSDEAISDGHSALHYGDDEDRISLEGTIYFSPVHAGEMTCFVNPVYQSSDGTVYATSESGFKAAGDHSEDSIYSRTFEETITITENGKSKSAHTLVKISIATMFPPERVYILQMDGDSVLLSRDGYNPGELPNSLTLKENVEFIIVETHKRDQEGNPIVSRSLYDESNESLETFYCRDDGILVKQWTRLDWLAK